jgi:hypothetical protein
MPVLGSTALTGHRGLPELLSRERIPGSNYLAVYVSMLIVELRSGEHLLTRTYTSKRCGLPKEMLAEHINLKI